MQRVDREGRWYVTYSGGTAPASHRLPCYARMGTQNVDLVVSETSRTWKIAVERKRPFLRERAFRCQGAAGGAGPRHRRTRQRVTSRYIPMAASNGTSVRKIPPSAAGRVASFSPVNSRGTRGSPARAGRDQREAVFFVTGTPAVALSGDDGPARRRRTGRAVAAWRARRFSRAVRAVRAAALRVSAAPGGPAGRRRGPAAGGLAVGGPARVAAASRHGPRRLDLHRGAQPLSLIAAAAAADPARRGGAGPAPGELAAGRPKVPGSKTNTNRLARD